MTLEPLEARLPMTGGLGSLPDAGLPASIKVKFLGDPAVKYPTYPFQYSSTQDFSAADGLAFSVLNNSGAVIRLGVNITSADGNVSTYAQNSQPFSNVELVAPFRPTLNIFGLPFEEPAAKWMNPLTTAASPTAITRVEFFLDRPSTTATLTITRAHLLHYLPWQGSLVDSYGQYTPATWPGKATDQASLAQMVQRDVAATAALTPVGGRDIYGGLLNSTVDFGGAVPVGGWGHFRTAKDTTGRWWFVTPLGNPYFSLGVNAAQPSSKTMVQGRESLFPAGTPIASDGTVDFYARNIQQYNSLAGTSTSWQSRTLTRLAGWGFNSVGNWPAESLTQPVSGAPHLPYTRSVSRNRLMPAATGSTSSLTNFPGTTATVPTFYTSGGQYAFADVFSPSFINYATQDTVTAQTGTNPDGSPKYQTIAAYFGTPEVPRTNNDPYAIGMYVDNEIRWDGGAREETMAVARAALNFNGSQVRDRFLQELSTQYASVASLLQAWNASLAVPLPDADTVPVNLLGTNTINFPTDLNTTAQADLSRLLGVYADQYYKTVHDGFKAHLPNKLYLGSRLYEGNAPAQVLQAAAKYVDVLSLNFYRKPEDLAQVAWGQYAALNKPLIISEAGFTAVDRGLFAAQHDNQTVATQAERGIYYQQYMNLIASNPLFVGASLFKYVDDTVTGLADNPENANWGLVNILDLPYSEHVSRVSAWNAGLYDHRQGIAITNAAPQLGVPGSIPLSPIDEDQLDTAGTSVQTLMSLVTDTDSNAEGGIAVTSLGGATSGTWQYTLDGGITWYNFNTVSAATARLLPATGEYSRVRFQPNANFNGSLDLAFAAWDQTTGYAGDVFDLTAANQRGGASAFSTATNTTTLLVRSVNDAPVLDKTVTPTLANISEDSVATYGTPVWTLTTGFSDVDLGALRGIAITAADTTNGTWQYTINSGASWLPLGAVSVTSARLLPANGNVSKLRFVPKANFFGTAAIEYTAWDQSQGTAGGYADLASLGTGGSTAFSNNSRTGTLTIDSVNDAPTGLALSAQSIAENVPLGSLIGTLSTTDVDQGDTFTYSFVAGTGDTDNGMFTLRNGHLLTATLLDYETKATYSFRLRTTDAGGLTKDAVFILQVLNGNDAPSAIAPAAIGIAENAPAHMPLTQFSTSDQDANDAFLYSLVSGDGDAGNAFFELTSDGHLAAINSFDFETQSSFTIRVRTTDSAGSMYEAIVPLTVQDINEAPTGLALDNTTLSENSASGTAVGFLTGSDPDGGDELTFSLDTSATGNNNAAFSIRNNLLVLETSADFETQSLYVVDLQVTDRQGLAYAQRFTIAITDVAEGPTAIGLLPATIIEGAPLGALVGQLTAADQDANDQATFTLVAGVGDENNNAFEIDSAGRLVSAKVFAFAEQSQFAVRVRVVDSFGLAYEHSLLVTIASLNQAPSAITLLGGTIAENQPSGAWIGDLFAVDPDAGDTASFTLVVGDGDTGNSLFAIQGDQLIASQAFDFEALNVYSVRIRATDSQGAATESSFTISVTDINEAPSALLLSANSISENRAAGSLIGQLTSVDPDSADSFQYTFATGSGDDGNSRFDLSPAGELVTKQAFDFESSSAYSVRIRTTDALGAMFEQTFTVSVNDENEAPTLLPLSGSLLAENLPPGAIIGNILSVDPDAGDSATFTLVAGLNSNGNSLIQLVGTQLVSSQSLDHEALGSFTIRIRATDHQGLFDEQSYTIVVADVNEAPHWSAVVAPTLNTIREDVRNAQGTPISVLAADSTDPDLGARRGIAVIGTDASKGVWQYSLSWGNWRSLGPVSPTSARLIADLGSGTRLRFVPNVNFNGTATISYVAWDQTQGKSGDLVNLSIDSTGAFGAQSRASALVVQAVNDAPRLTSSVVVLPSIKEDVRNSYGAPVWTLLGKASDPDAGALRGLAITSANQANGTWQYTLNNGALWSNMGDTTAATARLLPAAGSQSRVRFVPNQNFNGTVKFTFVAWDQTQGRAGDVWNLSQASAYGGITAFSTANSVASLLVEAVNDPPTITLVQTQLVASRNAAPLAIAANATVGDADQIYFSGGWLKVEITTGADPADVLSLGGFYNIQNGNVIWNNAVIVGTIQTGSGVGALPFLIEFNANASKYRVDQLVKALTFATAANAKVGTRLVRLSLNDGTGTGVPAILNVQVR